MTEPHATSGTARRPAHLVSGQGLTFRLTDEIDSLWQDLPRTSGQRSAKTLAKSDNLRIALVALDAGIVMDPQAAAGGASLQVLQGRLNVHADGHRREVGPDELVVLSRNLREPVEAVERSVFLAMVAWPNGAGAWDMEEASGHL
jgi:quercetin dioxygenase-like cupin family protein